MVRLDLTMNTDPRLMVDSMLDFVGEVLTIKEINSMWTDVYRAEGGGNYWWSDKCFVDLKSIPSLLDLIGGTVRELE